MKPASLLYLATADLRANKSRAWVAAAGIALGVAVLVIVAGLGLGARELVLKEIVRELPVDTIEVIPRTLDLGLFKVEAGGLLGGARIDETTLDKLAATPHVRGAYPKLEVNLPLGAEGGMYLFKRRLYTDLFMTGLPAELVQAEVGPEFRERTDIVPVVVSDQLLEVYNSSVASALKLPQLTAETLSGFEFDLVIGRSLMLGSRGAKQSGRQRARIVGVSRYAMRFGVTVPLETARRLLRTYAQDEGEDEDETYAAILLRTDSPASVPAVTQTIKALGLAVDESAQRTGDILAAATVIASLVGLLVLALAALNIAHSFFASLSERRRELAILRATGARQGDVLAIVLAQAALLGLAGGIAGSIAAQLVAAVLDAAADAVLPQFPFKPESFFYMPLALHLGALAAAIAAALLGALWPALGAARTQVARALAEV